MSLAKKVNRIIKSFPNDTTRVRLVLGDYNIFEGCKYPEILAPCISVEIETSEKKNLRTLICDLRIYEHICDINMPAKRRAERIAHAIKEHYQNKGITVDLSYQQNGS